MIEVKMWLYSPEEASMFAQFTGIVVDRRKALHTIESTKFEQAARDLDREQESIAEKGVAKEAYGKSVVQEIAEKQQIVNAAIAADVGVTAAISAFKAYAEKNGIPAARAALDKVGVKRAGDITEAQVPALLEAIK